MAGAEVAPKVIGASDAPTDVAPVIPPALPQQPDKQVAAFGVEEPDSPASSSQAEGEVQQRGLLRRVVGGAGYYIIDSMSFVGEVLVEWLELDKPRYHHEIKELKKRQRREARRRQQRLNAAEQQESAEIASIEEAATPVYDDSQGNPSEGN